MVAPGNGEDTVGRAMAALDRLVPTGALGLAVSGGSDSVALLRLGAAWGRARGRRIVVATIDHGLRGAARAEAAAVRRLAGNIDLEHHVLEVDTVGSGNLQGRAREARYAALAGWAAAEGLSAVATAHTEDDQAETVLMRLARGAGANGLAGIAERRLRRGPPTLAIVRPLLCHSRAELRAWLRREGLGWIEDPTNLDPAFERVRIRAALATLAPLGIGAPALARTATRLRGALDVLEGAAATLAAGNLALGIAGEVTIAARPIAAAPRETAMRVFARAAQALTGAAYPPRGEALERALGFVKAVADGSPPPDTPFAEGVLLSAVPGASAATLEPLVTLCRERAACAAPVTLQPGTPAVWDERLALPVGCTGPARALGALGPARLTEIKKAGRLFCDGRDVFGPFMRAPRPARLSAPALILPDGGLSMVHLAMHGWAAPEASGSGPPTREPVHERLDVFHRGV
ncbi:MAG: tRNA lysidine(34) synthetase TilS [Pseudomonadota bacterium]